MTTLLALLAASRVFAMREAVVARMAERFPEVDVRAHPGKLDIADGVAEDAFRAPAIAVGVTAVMGAEGRMSGQRDVPVECAAYLVVEDLALGEPPRLVTRDELGLALSDGVLELLADGEVSRWGLTDIGFPENAAARPLFTAVSFKRGTAYYAVTWRQTLYSLGNTFMEMDGPVPADLATSLVGPGDPGWVPPAPPPLLPTDPGAP